jgi:hypothetical protein
MRPLVLSGEPLHASLRVPEASLDSELQRMFPRYLGWGDASAPGGAIVR